MTRYLLLLLVLGAVPGFAGECFETSNGGTHFEMSEQEAKERLKENRTEIDRLKKYKDCKCCAGDMKAEVERLTNSLGFSWPKPTVIWADCKWVPYENGTSHECYGGKDVEFGLRADGVVVQG